MKLATRTILGALLAIGIGGCVDDAGNPAIGESPAVGNDAGGGTTGPTIDPAGGFDANADSGTDAAPAAPPPITGKTFALTVGADSFTGEEANDAFTTTTAGGFGTGDVLDGAGGYDILSVLSTANLAPTGVTVSNIEAASLTSLGSLSVDSTSWSGLAELVTQAAGNTTVTAGTSTSVKATSVGSGSVVLNGGSDVTISGTNATSGTIRVGALVPPAGAITVTNAAMGAPTMGAIDITGGTSVSIQQTASNAVATMAIMGPVTVTGTAATTSVSVASSAPSAASAQLAGVAGGPVSIRDQNSESGTLPGSITTIALSGYQTASIKDSALTTLGLTRGFGNVIIENGNLGAPTNRTLGVTVDGVRGGSLADSGVYTKLNITTAGTPSTIANVAQAAVTTFTVGGTKTLTLVSTAGMPALATVRVEDAAGLAADFSSANVTSVTNAGSGDVTVTIDASKATFAGSSGTDRVTTSGAPASKAIDLGAGDDYVRLQNAWSVSASVMGGTGFDTLSIDANFAQTASNTTAFGQMVSGFEALEITGTTNQTVDVANLGSITLVTTRGGNGFNAKNLPSEGTFVLNGAGTAYTVSNAAFAARVDDVVNLVLSDRSTAGVNFASNGVAMPNVETIHITTVDGQATPSGTFNDSVTILGNTAKALTVAGNAGLSLNASGTALTTIDASGITLGGFTFHAGALAGAATIKGSASGTNNLDGSSAKAITYVGGAGTDNVTLDGNHFNHVIDLGNGDNYLSIGNGSNAITAGNGNDYIQLGASTGPSSIDVGSGTDYVALMGIPQSSSAFATVTGFGIGDSLELTATKGTANAFSAQSSLGAMVTGGATFSSYLDACAAGDAHGVTVIKWFQLDGKTFIVHDTSAAATFQDGHDTVIALTGLIDLSTATISGKTIHL